MKRSLAFLLSAIILSVSLYSCTNTALFGKGTTEKEASPEMHEDIDTGEDTQNVPEYLDAPETLVQENITQLTVSSLITDIRKDDTMTASVSGFDKNGGRTRYYRNSVINGTVRVNELCDVIPSEGNTKYYVKTDDGYTEQKLPEAASGNASAYFEKDYEIYGINYENRFENARFLRLNDSVIYGKDCTIYEMTAKDKAVDKEVTMQIYVDKESGLWLYAFSTDGYVMTVTDFSFDAHGVPGVTPVKIAANGNVMYNNQGVVITAEKMTFDHPDFAAIITLKISNNTQMPIKVSSESFSVNGMCLGGSVISQGCPANGSANATIEIPNTALRISGTDIIQNVSAVLNIVRATEKRSSTSDSVWYEETDFVIASEQDAVFTTDYSQEAAKKNRNSQVGIRLISEKDFSAEYLSFEPSEKGGMYIIVRTENKNLADNRRARIMIVGINGKKTDIYDNMIVYKGTKSCSRIYISAEKLTELGFSPTDPITELELDIRVYNGESFGNTTPFIVKNGIRINTAD